MDLAQMVVNLAGNIVGPLWHLLWVVGQLAGLGYAIGALIRVARANRVGGQGAMTLGDALPLILVCTVMTNLSFFLNSTWASMGPGTVTYGQVSYSGTAGLGRLAEAVDAALTLLSLFGGWYFFKGVLLLKRAAVEGQSPNGTGDHVLKAFLHMIAGSMLVQIAPVIEAARVSLNLAW